MIGLVSVVISGILVFLVLPFLFPVFFIALAAAILFLIFLVIFAVAYTIIYMGYAIMNLRRKAEPKKQGRYKIKNTKVA